MCLSPVPSEKLTKMTIKETLGPTFQWETDWRSLGKTESPRGGSNRQSGAPKSVLSVGKGERGERKACLSLRACQVSRAPDTMKGGTKNQGLISVWVKLPIYPSNYHPSPKEAGDLPVRHRAYQLWARAHPAQQK